MKTFCFKSCALILVSVSCFLWLFGCTTSPSRATFAKPERIALLVPLQGANGAQGRAIRNGFLAAYYYAKQGMSNAPTVNVIDTSRGDIVALYQRAIKEGAQMVVGPLAKRNLLKLARAESLPVPVLGLNTIDVSDRIKHLYQFSLSTEAQAAEVAARARRAGYDRALIIVPSGRWGSDIGHAFARQWRGAGGEVAAQVAYVPRGDLAPSIERAVTALGEQKSTDVVFLAALPMYARQIKPLLTFYAQDPIAVYATSLVYSGIPSGKDHDLDGVIFNDMPWVLDQSQPVWNQLRAHIKTLWPRSYRRFPRLYALGIDAYHLVYAFDQLFSGMNGATGTLSIDHRNRIQRQLMWAQFKRGVARRVN